MADNLDEIIGDLAMKLMEPINNRIIIKPRISIIPRIFIRPRMLIKRTEMPYWQEMGWVKDGNSYNGFYKTRYGDWEGKVEPVHSREWKFYIYKPPLKQLKRHPHWPCFQKNGSENCYWLHFSRPPKDVSSGIIEIENIINESFKK